MGGRALQSCFPHKSAPVCLTLHPIPASSSALAGLLIRIFQPTRDWLAGIKKGRRFVQHDSFLLEKFVVPPNVTRSIRQDDIICPRAGIV